jgi:lipoprotein-releasing system permease protein
MSFEIYVALRYLLAKRRQAFISVITLISVIGVSVGVMALVIALAITTGVQTEMRDRLLAATAHVYVWKDGGIEDYRKDVEALRGISGVVGVGPAVVSIKAMVRSRTGESTFISIKGIDPTLEGNVTDIVTTLQEGSIDGLAPVDGVPGIVIGRELAASLGVRLGDTLDLTTPKSTLTPGGLITTGRSRTARVVGIFSLGMLEFDSQWGFIDLDFAQQIAGTDQPELYQIRVADPFIAPAVAERIVSELGDTYDPQHWQELNQSLFSALWMEKVVITLAISLIVIVAALQIVGSLILMVMEKSHDIGILKTLGTSSRTISTIFMLQGLAIGVVGTVVGSALSLAICWLANTYKLARIPMDVYQVSYIPFIVRPGDFALVVAGAILVSFIATIYPSRQAARLDPVQALRFE